MGYDDNTPLTGVTGGGLPAEIWHEVMVRVEDGLPARPLPMIVPEARIRPDLAVEAAPAQPDVQPLQSEDAITAILKQVLTGGN